MKNNSSVGEFKEQHALPCKGAIPDSKVDVRCVNHESEARGAFQGIVGQSSALVHILELGLRAARTNCTILIQGETGTGKEVLARGIHANSNRASKPFVTLNCGAIPGELFESELFGHVQGAFTGAVRNRTGKAEVANEDTLFLDEFAKYLSTCKSNCCD